MPLLSTGRVGCGSSAFVNWTCGLWIKCYCQLVLWMMMDQVSLSTGLARGGSSAFVNWICDWWVKCFCQLDLWVMDQVLLSTSRWWIKCFFQLDFGLWIKFFFVNWACGLWIKCICQLGLWMSMDQVLLSTGPVGCGPSIIYCQLVL